MSSSTEHSSYLEDLVYTYRLMCWRHFCTQKLLLWLSFWAMYLRDFLIHKNIVIHIEYSMNKVDLIPW